MSLIQSPTPATPVTFTKGWLSPEGVFYPLQGLIHDWWAAMALGERLETIQPTTKHREKLFAMGWFRVRPESATVLKVHNDAVGELNAAQTAAVELFREDHRDIILLHEHRFQTRRIH
jgi:hypothetical protein